MSANTKILSQEEIISAVEQAAIRGANSAVDRVLLLLGINPEDPASISRLKDNLFYLEQRRVSEEAARKIIQQSAAKIVTTAVLGVLAWALIVFKDGLHDYLVTWLR